MAAKANYYPLLDSLRGVACLFVIASHSYTTAYLRSYGSSLLGGGYIGVDLFFVLSGFLITGRSITEYTEYKKIHIFNFYQKRLLRLYPPLILATIIFLVPYLFVDSSLALSNMFFVLTYTCNVVVLFQMVFPFLEYPSMFSHCWSLAIEEQFYVVFPLLFGAIMAYAVRKRRDNIIGTFPLFNVFFLLTVIILSISMKDYFYRFFGWRFLEIFFGGYLAFIYSKGYHKLSGLSDFSRAVIKAVISLYQNKFIAAFALISFFAVFCFDFSLNLFAIPTRHYLLTVLSSVIIVNAFTGEHSLYKAILAHRPLKYLGKISYGLYLYHAPIFFLKETGLVSIPVTLAGTLALDLACVSLALLVSVLSYELVEKQFLLYKAKISKVRDNLIPEQAVPVI